MLFIRRATHKADIDKRVQIEQEFPHFFRDCLPLTDPPIQYAPRTRYRAVDIEQRNRLLHNQIVRVVPNKHA